MQSATDAVDTPALPPACAVTTPKRQLLSQHAAGACLVCCVQGHTVDVDTALVDTSEVKDYPMILLLGIGELHLYQPA